MTADAPEVSIIVPFFNRRRTLERCVASVTAQTRSDWELILVDDGSTDGSLEIANALAAADRRIVTLSLCQNRGAQAARNAGISRARGSWIAFLDSDDAWNPGSLSDRLRLAVSTNAGAVYSACVVRERDGTETLWDLPCHEGHAYNSLLRSPGPMFQSLLVRRAVLTSVGPLDEGVPSHQEWDTAIRIARRARFAYLPQPTFLYDRSGDDGISAGLSRRADGYAYVVRKHAKDILLCTGVAPMVHHLEVIEGMLRSADRPMRATRVRRLRLLLLVVSPRAGWRKLAARRVRRIA